VPVTLLPPSAVPPCRPPSSLARPRTRLPRVPPAPVLYPVRCSHWSCSFPSAYSAYAAILKLWNGDTSEYPSSIGLSPLRRARSAKRELSTTTNGLIFRASAFVPHDGDGERQLRSTSSCLPPLIFPHATGTRA
jgi:hypothetical protein